MNLMPLLPLATTLLMLLLLFGCKRLYEKIKGQSGARITARLHEGNSRPAAVVFDLKLAPVQFGSLNMQLYDCTHISHGKTARFRLEFGFRPPLDKDSPKDFEMYPASCKFIAVPGSENSALLEDLKNTLEAEEMPRNVNRIPELSFEAVVLGLKQTQDPDGGYSSNPPGNWIAAKIFFPNGDDAAEVFLNLDPTDGKGEISIKDADYGNDVLRELAKVL